MASTFNYLKEHDLLDYDKLSQRASDAAERFDHLSDTIRAAEKRMAEIAVLETHITNYSKTREVYVGYRNSGYSKKHLTEHEGDIILHKAAKKAFDDSGVTKLPSIKSLKQEYAELLSGKKAAYPEYRAARDEMKELMVHKANVDQILGKTKDKEQHMER